MGNKSDKQKEAALQAQNAAFQNQFQTQVNQWKPSPYEEALNKEGMDWLSATNGENPLDISKLPGMAPYLDVFNAASAKQKGQRFGLGSLKFGAAGANPNLMAALAQQDESHRKQDAAAQLNNAFAIRNAEVRGSALPLIGIGENREAGKTSAVGGQLSGARNAWASHQVRPGFWAQMLQNTIGGAAQGGSAARVSKFA